MNDDPQGDPGERFGSRVSRARVRPPVAIYPVDPWALSEEAFSPEFVDQTEAIYALSNGYLGLRGDFEEGAPVSNPGVFLNGFHETWPIVYGERAYGYARTGQTIVNATDGKPIKLYVDDEPFELETASLLRFRRTLDFRSGHLERDLLWETPAGKRISVRSRRMVSLVHRHLAVITYEVCCENRPAHLIVSSEMMTRHGSDSGDRDPRRAGAFDGRVLEAVTRRADGRRVLLCHRTRNSGIHLVCGMDHQVSTSADVEEASRTSGDRAEVVFSVDARAAEPLRVVKYLAYHFAADCDVEELCNRAERTLSRNLRIGEERLFEEQREQYEHLWERGDVEIGGAPRVQQAVRFNLFELHQAAARAEGCGVPAKGLTGQGYEGHYFWDSEIYVLPYFVYTQPRVARNLLHFRYSQLDKARARAAELRHGGALYPWRTIDGEEASAYYAAGTAAYHINAAIAYAMRKYALATLDEHFLRRGGVEVLVETARFWLTLGDYSPRRNGAFCINGVTGPDEYTAVVDNNRYTNMMARENLRAAANAVDFLRDEFPEDFEHLVRATSFHDDELAEWQRAAEAMYLAVDPSTGIHPQDDTFLEKARWDCANTPAEDYPLLLHYHPLSIYRHQVIKQADVVMAMFLLGEDFTLEEKRRNFDYYDPLTTRDSSLSSCVQSIVASEVGYPDKAMEYFLDASLVDLADTSGNVTDGIHIASAGGVWMALVYGFAGMRDHRGELAFHPRVPQPWSRLRFPLSWRDRHLEVDISGGIARYRLLDGEAMVLHHEGERVALSPESPMAECHCLDARAGGPAEGPPSTASSSG